MNQYYRVLGVPSNATHNQIKERYRQLVRIYHPDRHRDPDDKKFVEEKLRQFNEAYDALSNPKKRTKNQPSLTAYPNHLNFGELSQGEQKTLTFRVDNIGTPVQAQIKKMKFRYSESNAWFKVVKGRHISNDNPFPTELVVKAFTNDLKPGERYDDQFGWEWVVI